MLGVCPLLPLAQALELGQVATSSVAPGCPGLPARWAQGAEPGGFLGPFEASTYGGPACRASQVCEEGTSCTSRLGEAHGPIQRSPLNQPLHPNPTLSWCLLQ